MLEWLVAFPGLVDDHGQGRLAAPTGFRLVQKTNPSGSLAPAPTVWTYLLASSVTVLKYPSLQGWFSRCADRRIATLARKLVPWASCTNRRMPASVVSSPTTVALIRMDESYTTMLATTFSSTPFGPGFASPVIIDSSSSASPSTISASAGTVRRSEPGRRPPRGSRGTPSLLCRRLPSRPRRAGALPASRASRSLTDGPHLHPVAKEHDGH